MIRTLNTKLAGALDMAPVVRGMSHSPVMKGVAASSIECDLCHFGCELIHDHAAKQACHLACNFTVCP
jgi:hypothetical protein